MADELYRMNADGTYTPVSTAAKYTTGYNPMLGTPADIQRQQAEAWKTLGTQAGVGALLTAGQIGLSALPTVADTYNEAELARLEKLGQAGKLGLSAGQRQQAEATTMNPVRALASESQRRGEAFQASMGDSGNVATLERERQATKKAVSDAAVRAGIAINQADLEAEERQRMEMEQRRAYKAEREKKPFEMIGQALSALAPTLGKVAAGFAESRQPYDAELLAFAQQYDAYRGKSVDELRELWKLGRLIAPSSPESANKLAAEAMAGGYVPGVGG